MAETKLPSLSNDDRAVIVKNLEESIALLSKNQRLASVDELHLKSLLSAICWEIKGTD